MTSILLIIALILNFIAVLYFVYRKAYTKGFKNGTQQMIDGLNQIAIDLDDPRFTVRVQQIDPDKKVLKDLRNKYNPTKDHEKLPFDVVQEEKFQQIVDKEYPVPKDDIDPFN